MQICISMPASGWWMVDGSLVVASNLKSERKLWRMPSVDRTDYSNLSWLKNGNNFPIDLKPNECSKQQRTKSLRETFHERTNERINGRTGWDGTGRSGFEERNKNMKSSRNNLISGSALSQTSSEWMSVQVELWNLFFLACRCCWSPKPNWTGPGRTGPDRTFKLAHHDHWESVSRSSESDRSRRLNRTKLLIDHSLKSISYQRCCAELWNRTRLPTLPPRRPSQQVKERTDNWDQSPFRLVWSLWLVD